MLAQLSFEFEPVGPVQVQAKTADILPFNKPVTWSDQDILALRSALLENSLRLMRDGRASEAAIQESYEWVISEGIAPFSFDVCASDCGYSAKALREYTLKIIEKKLVGFFFLLKSCLDYQK